MWIEGICNLKSELCELLQERFVRHHFEDAVGADGLVFNHRLQPGPATTRNATPRPEPVAVPAKIEGAPATADGRTRPDRGATRRERVTPAVRTLRRRLEEIERQIHDLEARLQAFAEALSDPELYKDGDRVRTVSTGRKSAEEQVAWLMREWEALSVELSAHE